MKRLIAHSIGMAALVLCAACGSLPGARQGTPSAQAEQTPSDEHARAALRLLQKGDWQAAVARATVAVAMDPENPALHLLLASAHHRGLRDGQKAQGDLAEAGYKVAANLDPANLQAVRNLGALYMDQQRYRAAQAALSRAVQLDDTDGATFHLLAVAAYQAKDLGTALWAVRKAADMLPQDAGVLRGAAVIHAALDMREQAGDFSSRFARTAPGARDLEDLKKTLDRWQRQGRRWQVAQADTGSAGPSDVSAPAGSGARAGNTGGDHAGDTADALPRTSVPIPGDVVIGEKAPVAAPASTDAIASPKTGVVSNDSAGNEQGFVPPANATALGANPSPPTPPALEVLARDWRDCKQHFSEYDFRDDGDAMGGTGGMMPPQPLPGGMGGGGSGDDETVPLRALPSPCKGLPLPRMVLVDAVILTAVEDDQRSNGVNLLDTLSIVLNGSREVTKALAGDGTWTTEVERRTSAALGTASTAGVSYSLNIANATRNRVEVLARPTLVALDRKPSTFFSGADVTVPVAGNYNGSLQDKQVGTSLSVTPTMLDGDLLMLNAKAARSFFAQEDPGEIDETLVTNRSTVTASVLMRYGQSLILSGMRERQDSESHGGVPVLKDTPGLQYLFSRRTSTRSEQSVLIVITPRRVESFDDVLTSAARGAGKDMPDAAFQADAGRVQAQVAREQTSLPSNVVAILSQQKSSAPFQQYMIQRADLGPLRTQSRQRFDIILEDLRNLLYF